MPMRVLAMSKLSYAKWHGLSTRLAPRAALLGGLAFLRRLARRRLLRGLRRRTLLGVDALFQQRHEIDHVGSRFGFLGLGFFDGGQCALGFHAFLDHLAQAVA